MERIALEQMVITTKVARASSKSPSVRTTIPEEIVEELKLKVGDPLIWKLDQHEGRKGLFVRKAE